MTTSQKALPAPSTVRSTLTQSSRSAWLASLGVLATLEEEGPRLFNTLVERGKALDKQRREALQAARQKAQEARDDVQLELKEAQAETQSALQGTIEDALSRLGVPTRSEIDRLSARVDALSAEIDTLLTALSDADASNDSA